MRRRPHTTAGFSLIELIITLGLAAGLGVVLGSIFIQNNQVFQTQNNQVSETKEINNLQLLFNKHIRNAAAIAAGYPVNNPTVVSDNQSLVLAVPSIDYSGNVITHSFDYIVITPDPDNPTILREMTYPHGGSSRGQLNQVLTTGLSDINFSYLSDDKLPVTATNATIVNFSVNITYGSGHNAKIASGSGLVNLRNN